VKGRLWLIIGALVGVAVAAGRLPCSAGAGRSLSDTVERLVGSRHPQPAGLSLARKTAVQTLEAIPFAVAVRLVLKGWSGACRAPNR
jgi:hypothetical protein